MYNSTKQISPLQPFDKLLDLVRLNVWYSVVLQIYNGFHDTEKHSTQQSFPFFRD